MRHALLSVTERHGSRKNQEIIRENSLGGFVHKIAVVNIPCLQVKANATQMNLDALNKLI
jgi:hypothetical protein